MPEIKHALKRLFISIKIFSRSYWGILLFIAMGWQALLTVAGWVLGVASTPLGHTVWWDAGWYMQIIDSAYSTLGSPAAPAFYPLFPIVVSLLHLLSFGILGYELSALIINTLSLWFILVALFKICKTLQVSTAAASFAIGAFLSFPSAFFLHVFYSEALFIAIASWSYLFSLQRKWWAVGLLLGILTATRLPSLLFIALCGLEYLRAYQWKLRKALNKNLWWFTLAPVGFILYGLYLFIVRGDFLAMFHAYSATSDWTYQVFNLNIFETVVEAFVGILNGPYTYELFINTALPIATLLVLVASASYLFYKLKIKGVPLFVFSILSFIFFTLNSNVVSVHRYVLGCLTIYLAVALLASTPRKRILLVIPIACSLIVQLFIYNKFVNGIFGG